METEVLIEKMKVVLASAFSLYLKSHNYHWNVTGPNFKQYHDFFSDYYENTFEAIDDYAEHIRALNSFTPGSLKRFSELSVISDELSIPSPNFMFVRLGQDELNTYENTPVFYDEELKVYESAKVTRTETFKRSDAIASFSNFEPRFSLSYLLNDDASVKMSYNRMVQYSITNEKYNVFYP